MFWSDHSQSENYNKLIRFKDFSYENLYKQNHTYDIILVINYNISPIIKGKGSAIFLHINKPNFEGTEGCIAIEKENIIELAKEIDLTTKLIIKD